MSNLPQVSPFNLISVRFVIISFVIFLSCEHTTSYSFRTGRGICVFERARFMIDHFMMIYAVSVPLKFPPLLLSLSFFVFLFILSLACMILLQMQYIFMACFHSPLLSEL